MLIPHLPAESALAVAQRMRRKNDPSIQDLLAEMDPVPRDPDAEAWSRAEQLLAAIADQLGIIHWTYLSAHSDKGKGPKWKPEPIIRPGVQPTEHKPLLEPEQQTMLAQYLSRTQGEEVTYN